MTSSGKVSLMIVEDDSNIRFLIETAAQRSRLFEPINSAADGQAALDHLRSCETSDLPALIVTDLSMPRMTGMELLRAVKNDDRMRNIPVAIITSSDVPNDRDVAFAAGACSFLNKPFGVDALARALVAITESSGKTTTGAASAA